MKVVLEVRDSSHVDFEQVLTFEDQQNSMVVTLCSRPSNRPEDQYKKQVIGLVSKDEIKRLARSI